MTTNPDYTLPVRQAYLACLGTGQPVELPWRPGIWLHPLRAGYMVTVGRHGKRGIYRRPGQDVHMAAEVLS